MAESQVNPEATAPSPDSKLEGGTYEIIRSLLDAHSKELRSRLEKLNDARKDVFGAVASKLVGSQRITTENNCVPRDIVNIGPRLLFGYNVFIGLRSETVLADVFACYEWNDGSIETCSLDFLRDERFLADFANLYKYYRNTVFAKFALIGPHLFMVFRISDDPTDVKTFKWIVREGELKYVDNRSDHEYRFPPQHEFEWKRATHEMHRSGESPHVSIQDRVFVETLHGDLTIKVEDNTSTGEGIYSEPVDDPDQTLSDAEIHYALVGNIIVLKIRPYQEQAYRYIVFNEKISEAVRIDSLADAGILLPDGHGLIFPRGYYLQTGERKTFDNDMTDMVFEKRIAAPNGEDFLYVFYNRLSGVYVLLRYNLISQQVDTPIVCNGYSLLEDGTLLYFRAEEEPQKHHAVQVWKTPFCGPDYTVEAKTDNDLYKIGNKDIVRCMAECAELLNLVGKQDSYANLYVDISRKAQDIRDSYFWIDHPEVFRLDEPLAEIQQSAAAAIDEYEKVVRTRQNTRQEINRVSKRVRDIVNAIDYYHLDGVNDFVEHLAELRGVRGEVISLRDLRYADGRQIDALEEEVAEHTAKLSGECVEFLLQPDSLAPYEERCEELSAAIDDLEKYAEARELSERVARTDAELEMLTEIVSNLKISDATQTTAIIDNISRIYSRLNQVKSKLKNRSDRLASAESAAEFSSQMKLVDQSVINFLDICDTPGKCDEYLTKVAVQLETLESRFAEFDQYIVQLSEKREEVYNAFESRKAQLNEQIARRASALQTSAQRILKGVRSRVAGMTDLNEINGYFASDLMIERIRETIDKLRDLGDTVKAEDIESQLKTIQQDTIRQLKDRQALFVDGQDVIRFGEHCFAVNRQALELTVVRRDGGMFFHLTGTGFFEPITDEDLLATRDVWDLDVVSESPCLYRAEYLAGQMLEEMLSAPLADQSAPPKEEDLLPRVREFMAPRYDEGYVKGVHDVDATKILANLLAMHRKIGLLRFHPSARALALLVRECLADDPGFRQLTTAAAGMGRMREFFDYHGQERAYIAEFQERIAALNEQRELIDPRTHTQAAEYLFHELADAGRIVAHASAVELRDAFRKHLRGKGSKDPFTAALADLEDPADRFGLIRRWLRGFLAEADLDDHYAHHLDESAVLLLLGDAADLHAENAPTRRTLEGMLGSHPLLEEGRYELDYCDLMLRLHAHR
ncbi:MAG: DNA repair ATPase, partial [Phycisphaerae bacterium]